MQGFPGWWQDVGPSVAAMGCGVVATGGVWPTRPHAWCLLLLLLTGRVAQVQYHPSPPDGALELLLL